MTADEAISTETATAHRLYAEFETIPSADADYEVDEPKISKPAMSQQPAAVESKLAVSAFR